MARKKRPDFNPVAWAREASYPHSREECRDCVHYGMRPPVCRNLGRVLFRSLGEPSEKCPFREEETAESAGLTFYPHSREQCRKCFFYDHNRPMCNNLSAIVLYSQEELTALPECPFREAMLM